jgi:hypothetical protein
VSPVASNWISIWVTEGVSVRAADRRDKQGRSQYRQSSHHSCLNLVMTAATIICPDCTAFKGCLGATKLLAALLSRSV